MSPQIASRSEDGREMAVLVWRFRSPMRCVSTAVLGGGIGSRGWIVNAQVPSGYGRPDPDRHLLAIARGLRLTGPGVGLMTAVDVRRHRTATEGGVEVVATVGLGIPILAAAAPDDAPVSEVGTINVIALVPERLSDAALVNAATTVAEAKVQAIQEAGIPATGTPTDAVCVACPEIGTPQPFGGPRSAWGAPLARAVREAVLRGIG
ncbi:MAG: adenosylcobinamide amidohydrolase [Actinobacteria bacterium]|nr:adenosylcobinamide amidohydrolase [Actinomycetota bacterium]MBV9663226.1 adenosylcobinamide amidohydrolase [Actinomycetota bacterium]MBV9934608.1 adenosylcobinamide amidohydrolase [Actinomycetota bacterium]